MLIVLVVLLAGCSGDPVQVPIPRGPVAAGAEARAQASKGAPMQVAPWSGPWTVVVYADAGSADAAAFAHALGAAVTPWDHHRPRPPAGTAALVWIEGNTPIDPVIAALGRQTGPAAGEVDVVLGEGAGTAAAVDRLPWSGVGVLAARSALDWWVEPGAKVPGLAVPLAAAREVADHYEVTYVPYAGTLGDPVLDAALAPAPAMFASTDVRVRAESRRSLRQPGDAPDPELPVQLVQAAFGDEALLAALAALPNPDPLLKARVADRTNDIPLLLGYTTDPSSVVRVVAANRLVHVAASGADRAPSWLRTLAGSGDAYVRWKAAWGLGRVPGSAAVLEVLIGDVDVDVRREAAHSLGVLGDPAGVPALLTGLQDPNSFVRRWAADGLAPFAARPEVVAALETAMHDPAAMVGMSAAKALRRPAPVWQPPHPADVAGAIRALGDPDPTTRKDACKFLAQVEDDAAQDALLVAAQDRDSEVRKSAVEALGWDEGPKGTAALTAALRDVDPDVVVTALDAFRRRGDLDRAAVQEGLLAGGTRGAWLVDGEVWLRLHEAIAASGDVLPGLDLADERAAAAFARRGLLEQVPTPTPWIVQLALATGAGHPPTPWQLGVLAREDLLVHLRFSWTDEADRVASHRALRAPVVREYGHPDRG